MKKLRLEPPSPEMIKAMKPFMYAMFPYMKTLDDIRELATEARRRNVKVAPERIFEILDSSELS